MSRPSHRSHDGRPVREGERLRREIQLAQLAARMLCDGEAEDFGDAKRRAAEHFGLAQARELPDNLTVLAAVIEHQRLFEAEAVAERTGRLRAAALRAMRRLGDFLPRLVGPVLYGTPFEHSPITLHLFSDEAEAVNRQLFAWKIRFQIDGQTLRVGGRHTESYPMLITEFGQAALDLVVMPHARLAHPPLSPLDGAPYRRITPAALEALLDSPAAKGLLPDLASLGLPPVG